MVSVACDRILEVSVARKLLRLGSRKSFSLVIALWEGGLPVDLLPAEGWFEVPLGRRAFRLAPGVGKRPMRRACAGKNRSEKQRHNIGGVRPYRDHGQQARRAQAYHGEVVRLLIGHQQ